MLEKAQEALDVVKKNRFLLPLDLQLFSGDPVDPPVDPQDPPSDPVDPPADPTDPQDPPKQQKSKSFSQEDVNAIAAKEAKKAQEKLLRQLGVTDLESAKDGLTKFKEIQDAQKTEAEKNSERLKELRSNNKSLETQVKDYQAQLAALKADVNPDSVEDVVVLASKLVSDDVSIEDAIGEVVKKYPNFKRVATTQQEDKKPKFSQGEHKKDDKQSEEDAWISAFNFGKTF